MGGASIAACTKTSKAPRFTSNTSPRDLPAGSDDLDNLAWACPGCNLHKSNCQQAEDPVTKAIVRVFDPRKHEWSEHFTWNGYRIAGLTPIGRALVAAFDLNSSRRQRIRQAEETFDLFPPETGGDQS